MHAPRPPAPRREDRRRGVFVDGLSEWVVRSPREVYELMMRGAEQVGTGFTLHHTVSRVKSLGQCSSMQCSAVQCSAVQCSAVQYSTARSPVQRSAVASSTIQYSTGQPSST
jgi:hypothetical protein